MQTLNPTRLAELGEQLYQKRFKEEFAPEHTGEILAIEVESKTAYLGKSALEALLAAKAAHENGFFHVVRIGGPGVYKMGLGRSAPSVRGVR